MSPLPLATLGAPPPLLGRNSSPAPAGDWNIKSSNCCINTTKHFTRVWTINQIICVGGWLDQLACCPQLTSAIGLCSGRQPWAVSLSLRHIADTQRLYTILRGINYQHKNELNLLLVMVMPGKDMHFCKLAY